MKLNGTAKATLGDFGITPTAWARVNFMSDGIWTGDACGCRDDRCVNYHHDEHEECLCLRVALNLYRDQEGSFADNPPPPIQRDDGRWYRPKSVTAEFVFEDDEESGVIVFGTHNAVLARKVADEFAASRIGRTYRAGKLAGGGWWRDGFEHGRRSWLADEAKGRAGVLFSDITEVAG